jgi:methylthioribulose-1-phosphate dehydratase
MRNAGACIHTHSQHAGKSSLSSNVTRSDSPVMLTLLLPRDAKSFRISHQEMIKGVRIGGHGKTLRFFDTLEVPIIENTADEEDLTSGMAEAMEKYPNAAAILVRRHGVYVWGMCFVSRGGIELTSRKHMGTGKNAGGVFGLLV